MSCRSRHVVALGAWAFLCACGTGSGGAARDAAAPAPDGPIVIGDSRMLPASVGALASMARALGGHVVVGQRGASSPLPDSVSQALPGLEGVFRRIPTERVVVTVTDALGETLPDPFIVSACAGEPRFVDADGNHVNVIGSGNSVEACTLGEGLLVLFTARESESADELFLLDWATMADGIADGGRTASGAPTPLAALRR